MIVPSGAWPMIASAAVLVTALASTRLLTSLPAPTRVRFVTAGAAYALALVGLATLGARGPTHGHPLETPTLATLVSVARLVEMLAVVLFMHALFSHTAVDVRLGAGGAPEAPRLD